VSGRVRALWLALAVSGGLASAGCEDKEAQRELAGLEPRLQPIRAKLKTIADALPPVGQEHAGPCATPLQGSPPLFALDERRLRAIAGLQPMDPGAIKAAEALSGSALEVPSLENLERLRKADALGAQVMFLKKRLDVSERVTHVVVVRTTTFDKGQLTGKEIVRPGSFTGWAFLADVAAGKILAAWPLAVRTADSVSGIIQRGQEKDLLLGNLYGELAKSTSDQATHACGATVVFRHESQF
jgi:hypothetical protein